MKLFETIAERYPQILLSIKTGQKNSEEYKNAVLRGNTVQKREPDFFSAEDQLECMETPVGNIDVLIMREREAFIHMYRALAYRCEPEEIPDSVGAGIISGLINWKKIHQHKDEYLSRGGDDWDEEFQRFISDKSNYLDSIVLLSSGPYSAVSAYEMHLTEEEWIEKSICIRKFHELTHYVCRKHYPGDIDAIRDEVLADAIGLLGAFGKYDTGMALRFLGIDDTGFLEGGRLLHYSSAEKLKKDILYAKELIHIVGNMELPPMDNAFEAIPLYWNELKRNGQSISGKSI